MTPQDNPQPSIARRWWAALQDQRADGTPNRVRDRAALARLRRAATPLQAVEEPAVISLYKQLGFSEYRLERRLPRVAVVAAVLAHVRSEPEGSGRRQSFAEMLGRGERPLMSALRFKRLLAASNDQDLLNGFRRAVALAGGRNIDVGDLAGSLLDWSETGSLLEWSEKRRMRWAFDYYGAGMAAPKPDTASTDDEE
jgi:CRISPR system Cascade subunit CasB